MENFTFVGVEMEKDEDGGALIEIGEARAMELWRRHLYGTGDVLGRKRVTRGWHGNEAYWGVEGVQELLEWKGGKSEKELFQGPLPWD